MEDNKKQELIKNLIYFRKKNGLTQLQLAEKLGYSNKNISKWEKGEITPDIFILEKLSKIYNISIDEFFNGENLSKEELLSKQIEENKKLKKSINILVLMSISALLTIIATVVSIYFINRNPSSRFVWLPYLYLTTILSIFYHIFYKASNKKINVLFLVIFCGTIFASIYLTANCSPWLFLLCLPFFLFLFYFSNLVKMIKNYIERLKKIKKEKNNKNEKEENIEEKIENDDTKKLQ